MIRYYGALATESNPTLDYLRVYAETNSVRVDALKLDLDTDTWFYEVDKMMGPKRARELAGHLLAAAEAIETDKMDPEATVKADAIQAFDHNDCGTSSN
jgi:hypothetical protein